MERMETRLSSNQILSQVLEKGYQRIGNFSPLFQTSTHCLNREINFTKFNLMSKAAQLKDQAWKLRNQRDESVKETLRRVQNLIAERPKLTAQYRNTLIQRSATQIAQLLNKGQITSVDILLCLSQRSFTYGLTHCLITQSDFDNALKQAQQCDKHRHESKLQNYTLSTKDSEQSLPCLYGVPISLKDTIDMKGTRSSVGVVVKARRIVEEDGLLCDVIRRGGMIPFVKTNIPQVAMTYDSVNFIWGRADNPWDTKRTTGGSSGGEGGLIAARGSLLGIGADIGGSLRIPAEFCGIYSLKPSVHRLSFKGHTEYSPSFNGQINIPAVVGPMGSSPDDLALLMRVMTQKSSYDKNPKSDPFTYIVPFDLKLYQTYATSKKLRIGYFDCLDLVQTTKASRRAVHEVVQVLRELGHQLLPITIKDEKEIIGMYIEVMGAEGGLRAFTDMLQGEELIREYRVTYLASKIPKWMNGVLSWIVGKFQPRTAFTLRKAASKSAYQYLLATNRQLVLQKDWVKYWREQQLDLVIAPGFGSQAQLHGYSQLAFISAAYTFMWNVLHMTAASMPITLARQDQQTYQSKHNDIATNYLKQSAVGSAGLPVGIQIVGLPYEQQKVLSLMKAIDQKVQFSKKYKPNI